MQINEITNYFKRNYIIVFIISILGLRTLYTIYTDHYYTIASCIELTPSSDTKVNLGKDWRRELIYNNDTKDPKFYQSVVNRVERCNIITKYKCRKQSGREMRGTSLRSSRFSDSEISESVTFKSEDNRYTCTVSNGGRFVLVLIYGT